MRFIDSAYVKHVAQINPNYEITEEVIDGVYFMHIDNVLLYPEEFTHYLKESFPVGSSYDWDIDQAPGHRQWIPSIWVKPLQDFYHSFAKDAFFNWGTNIYRGNMPVRRQNYLPHTDEARYAFNLWLNKEALGGTAFYKCTRFNPEGDPSARSAYGGGYEFWKEFYTRETREEPWRCFKGDSDWHLYHIAEMKYNRVSVYDGWLWHAAYIEPEWYTEEDRYSLVAVDVG